MIILSKYLINMRLKHYDSNYSILCCILCSKAKYFRSNKVQKVLGVQLYTVREFTQTLNNFEETVKKLANIGYSAVQISAIGPLDPADVAKVCKDNQVTIAGTHISWDDFRNKTEDVIAKHKIWNCPHSAVGSLPAEYYMNGIDGIKRFVEELQPILEKLNAEGIDFSYHNHNQEFVKADGKPLLEWIYELGGENLLPEIDTYWIQAGGANPAGWIRKFPGKQPLLHLKDMSIHMDENGRTQHFAAIGEGNLDWDDILSAAEESQCRWYLVEQDDCYGRDPFDCLTSSFNFLKSKGLS